MHTLIHALTFTHLHSLIQPLIYSLTSLLSHSLAHAHTHSCTWVFPWHLLQYVLVLGMWGLWQMYPLRTSTNNLGSAYPREMQIILGTSSTWRCVQALYRAGLVRGHHVPSAVRGHGCRWNVWEPTECTHDAEDCTSLCRLAPVCGGNMKVPPNITNKKNSQPFLEALS